MEANKRNEWLDWLKSIFLAVGIAILLKTFVFTTSIVEGESMEPTLENGEKIIFNKMIYMVTEPERGDIVFIQRPQKNYVKRIIGLPKETIEINQGELYIDGVKQEQTYLDEKDKHLTGNIGPLTIPDNSYFVMGDNRAISKDSRNGLGLINKSEIVGRSEIIIYPFSEVALTK